MVAHQSLHDSVIFFCKHFLLSKKNKDTSHIQHIPHQPKIAVMIATTQYSLQCSITGAILQQHYYHHGGG
jgi:hypothetical protein